MTKVRGFTWTVEDVNLISETEIWGDVLVELAHTDPRIVALSADLAHSTKLLRFKQTFPNSKLAGNVDMILPDLERRLAGKNQ